MLFGGNHRNDSRKAPESSSCRPPRKRVLKIRKGVLEPFSGARGRAPEKFQKGRNPSCSKKVRSTILLSFLVLALEKPSQRTDPSAFLNSCYPRTLWSTILLSFLVLAPEKQSQRTDPLAFLNSCFPKTPRCTILLSFLLLAPDKQSYRMDPSAFFKMLMRKKEIRTHISCSLDMRAQFFCGEFWTSGQR